MPIPLTPPERSRPGNKSGVQGTIRIQPCDPVACRTVDGREDPADDDLRIRLNGHGVNGIVDLRIETVRAPVFADPGQMSVD